MNIIKKIFGLGGAANKASKGVFIEAEEIVDNQVQALITFLNLDLHFHLSSDDKEIRVDFEGKDLERLTDKEGQLLDALQFYVKRTVQHNLPDAKMGIFFDADGFREDALQNLMELADKLKGIALDKNKSVYFRALAPKDRKVVHQYLAKDDRVKSKSIGDGLYKKIKVFPANLKNKKRNRPQKQSNA